MPQPIGINTTAFALHVLVGHWVHFASMVLLGVDFLVGKHMEYGLPIQIWI
jgi:hypothetical protein